MLRVVVVGWRSYPHVLRNTRHISRQEMICPAENLRDCVIEKSCNCFNQLQLALGLSRLSLSNPIMLSLCWRVFLVLGKNWQSQAKTIHMSIFFRFFLWYLISSQRRLKWLPIFTAAYGCTSLFYCVIATPNHQISLKTTVRHFQFQLFQITTQTEDVNWGLGMLQTARKQNHWVQNNWVE